MNPGPLANEAFRLKTRLSNHPQASSFLASPAARGRASLVVKYFSQPASGPLTEFFRADVLDLASLHHESFARPRSFGRDENTGQPYVVRAYIDGSELSAVTRGMPPRKLLPWLLAAAEAIRLLHRFGLLHCNIKASNFIVPRSRHSRDAKIIACDPTYLRQGDDTDPRMVNTAPELRRGEHATFASDLYALGAVFYRLLTGKEEVETSDSGFPEAPAQIHPEVPRDLERLIMKLLSPDPARRYHDTPALIDDLRLLCGSKGPVEWVAPDWFVGRNAELQRAIACIEGNRQKGVIAVTGEAGMGKSAFLSRLALEAQLRGYTTALVRCYPENTVPLSPVRTLVEQLTPRGPAGRALRARYRKLLEQTNGREARGNLRDDVEKVHDDVHTGSRRTLLRGLLDLIHDLVASRPTVLLVDEVHFADSLTVDLLRNLVRESPAPADKTEADRQPARVALSFRNEAPFRQLRDAFRFQDDHSLVLELPPLAANAVSDWIELALCDRPEARDRIRSASPRNPFAIREAIRLGSSRPGPEPTLARDLPSIHLDYLASLHERQRKLLEYLAVLGRPASADLLRDLLAEVPVAPHRHGYGLQDMLEALLREGILSEDGSRFFFQHGSFHGWLKETVEEKDQRAIHRRIAEALEGRGDSFPEEVAHHWLESDTPHRGADTALVSARRLTRSHEDRRALHFYQALLEILPPAKKRLSRTVAEEMADAYSRIGHHRRTVEILKELLEDAKDPGEVARLLRSIGVSYHRAGEIGRAVSHLERGLRLLTNVKGQGGVRDRLRMKSELAEIAINKGDYKMAEGICLRAMEEIGTQTGASKDREIRRAEMLLLETLAHVRLRRFQYEDARKLFEKSLSISGELGAVPERSLILNNLGILHNQENRFPRAIECYQQAEKLSAQLGEDLILVNIHSNLGLLFAKCGQVEAADEALRNAALHDARCDSSRTHFLRLHCAGIVDVYLGRYASAIATFKQAIDLGEELKDSFLTGFDLVYLGECHLLRGEAKAARGAFDRAVNLDSAPPDEVIAMIAARRAVLAALRGEAREAKASIASYADKAEGQLPFLQAWDRVFLGWTHRLLGHFEEAARELEEAKAFFARVKVPLGEIQATLELAALDADTGRSARAEKRLRGVRARYSCGRGVLRNPMLSGRLLAYQTRLLLERDDPDVNEATAILVEAESYLIGRCFRDLETLVRELRRRLRLASLEKQTSLPLPPDAPRDASADLEILQSFTGTARDLIRRFEDELGEQRTESLRRYVRDFEEHVQQVQRASEGSEPSASLPFRATSILGKAPLTRKMIDLIRQVAPSGLAVLVTGETGTGKELVARAIHGESPRRSSNFVTLNCAALPENLLEAELFGHVRGAFTGAEDENRGILVNAAGGTVFFDEVGELPLTLQAKLLRVLDRALVRPVGGIEEVETDVRYIFATHQNLPTMVDEGKFREDLFFRIRAVEIGVPSLRDRLEDLPLLADYFGSVVKTDLTGPLLEEGAKRAMANYTWPGNVRELQNVVTHLVLTCSLPVTARDVKLVLSKKPTQGLFSPSFLRSRSLAQLVGRMEKEYFVQLYADCGGDMKAMAASQGVTPQGLYKRFKSLGIRPKELK